VVELIKTHFRGFDPRHKRWKHIKPILLIIREGERGDEYKAYPESMWLSK